MKYTIAILMLTFTMSFTALAGTSDKTTGGVYLTADDFTNGKLMSEQQITKSSKSDVYGFRDSHGRSYRFVGDKPYEIREAGPLYIYKTDRLVRKGAVEPAYFFSVGPTQRVLPLTIANLKNAVGEDHRFQEFLDMTFRNDSDLTRFDKSQSTYAVNRLLRATTTLVATNKSQGEPMQHMMMANCTEHCQTADCASRDRRHDSGAFRPFCWRIEGFPSSRKGRIERMTLDSKLRVDSKYRCGGVMAVGV